MNCPGLARSRSQAGGYRADEKGQHAEVAVDWSRSLKDPPGDGLPMEYRTAFLLHDVEALANLEIAQTLRVNPVTVQSRVHRARLLRRRRLADYMGASLDAARL